MTLPFQEEIINDKEINQRNFERARFIGYLSPNGQILNYSRPLGLGGHDVNPCTELFIHYFYLRESGLKDITTHYKGKKYKGLEIEKIDAQETKEELEEIVNHYKKIYARRIERRKEELEHGIESCDYFYEDFDLREDLIKFFFNCYSSNTFETGFGRNITIMSEEEYAQSEFLKIRADRDRYFPMVPGETLQDYRERIPAWYDFSNSYERYKTSIYLSFLKDVLVEYLGYHYVSRTPRTIYTSSPNIYETFYNYFLNDYTIYQLPKMVYNPLERRYVKLEHSEFFIPDREIRLQSEIASIKKLVPIENRSQYYR